MGQSYPQRAKVAPVYGTLMLASIVFPAPGYPGHCGEVVIDSVANSDMRPPTFPPTSPMGGTPSQDESPTKSPHPYPGEIHRVPTEVPAVLPPSFPRLGPTIPDFNKHVL